MKKRTSRKAKPTKVAGRPIEEIYSPRLAMELCQLEALICDVERANHIAFLMTMHDEEHPDHPRGSLGLFAIEQAERLAMELKKAFYAAGESARAAA
jgi:hypothetical protein